MKLVEGWALDAFNPADPVELDLRLDAEAPMRIIANRYRLDLDRAGLADGCCGFSIALPSGAVFKDIVRSADGRALPIQAAAHAA